MCHFRPYDLHDKEKLLRFVTDDPILCLFIDELHGTLNQKSQLHFWIVEKSNGFSGMLMNFGGNWVPFFKEPRTAERLATYLDEQPYIAALHGSKEEIEEILPLLKSHRTDLSFPFSPGVKESFAVLNHLKVDPLQMRPAFRAGKGDTDDLIDLYGDQTAGEMCLPPKLVRSFVEQQRFWCCRNDAGKMVSGCFAAVMADRHVIVGGVYTRPHYRKQDWATSCLAGLCRELMAEGKRPCLFYHDPNAAPLYRKLGFEILGTWNMYKLAPAQSSLNLPFSP